MNSSNHSYEDRCNDVNPKGTNFSIDETEALLQGIRAHQHIVLAQTLYNPGIGQGVNKVSLVQRKLAWQDISSRVEAVRAVNGGERRTIVQLKQRWKNLKQRAYKDYYQQLDDASGDDDSFKCGEYTKMVVDLIGKERIITVCGANSGNKHDDSSSSLNTSSVSVASPSTSTADKEPYIAISIKEESAGIDDEPILINDSEPTQPAISQSDASSAVNDVIVNSITNSISNSNNIFSNSNTGFTNIPISSNTSFSNSSNTGIANIPISSNGISNSNTGFANIPSNGISNSNTGFANTPSSGISNSNTVRINPVETVRISPVGPARMHPGETARMHHVEPARKKQKIVLRPPVSRRPQTVSSRINALNSKPGLSLPSTLRSVPPPRLVKPSQDRQLVAAETRRAEAQARLAEEQTKLTVLRQQETKLRMLLLQSKLQDVGVELGESEEDQIQDIELDMIDNGDEF